MLQSLKYLWLTFALCLPRHCCPQEVGLEAGLNKVGFTPAYRAFSEQYQPAFQTDIAWSIADRSRHQAGVGLWAQWNFQRVIGHQLNFGPLFRYRFRVAGLLFAEFQTGYGFQLLFPQRRLYQQHNSGAWESGRQMLTNHLVPFRIGIGQDFGRHTVQFNYSYQLIFGFNPSIGSLPVEQWAIGYRRQIGDTP